MNSYKKSKKNIIAIAFSLILSLVFIFSLNIKAENKKIIKNLGKSVNTNGDEFFPSLTIDGKMMVFNLRKKGEKRSNVYYSEFKNSKWTKPKSIDIMNSESNEETPYISSDGKTIIFSSNREGTLKPEVTKDNVQYITTDLYISKKVNGKWSKPKRIEGDVNTVANERAPSLSRDKKTLYFSRWIGDNIENSRIMQATLKDGEYGNVQELPYPVNSGYSDYGLYPSNKRSGFYFSSNRPGGKGGWDIYFVEYNNSLYSNVTNLGKDTNSEDNELSITEIGKKIFFCSNRSGGFGLFDLYSITIPEKILKPKKIVYGYNFKFINADTKVAVQEKFRFLFKKDDNKAVKSIKIVSKNSDLRGQVSFIISKDDKRDSEAEYIVVKNDSEKFNNFRKSFKINKKLIINKTIEISLKVNKELPPFDFYDIYFYSRSSKVKMKYIPYLHKILYYMREHLNVNLTLIGHTDRFGDYIHNQNLSLKRANSVKKYLIKLGIDERRIVVKGIGYSDPTVKKFDYINRRVEFEPYLK